MLTLLIVALAIVYIIIGMTIGTLCVLMYVVSDGARELDYVRDLYYNSETDPERSGEILGTCLAGAIISIIWPVGLVWLFCCKEYKN